MMLLTYFCVQSHNICPAEVAKNDLQVFMNFVTSDFFIDVCHLYEPARVVGAQICDPLVYQRSFLVHLGVVAFFTSKCEIAGPDTA